VRIAFRVDASSHIGTGHLMRCVSLADALKWRGVHVRFVSREMPITFRTTLSEKQHELVLLPGRDERVTDGDLAHSQWLSTTQAQDAEDSLEALGTGPWDWLIVDHYALDARWESRTHRSVERIMVIDDIADRPHDCDVLLDQNPYHDKEHRYLGKVPAHCQLLLGPRYALLRDEFRRLHVQVKPRSGSVSRVLVLFGGVDAENYTDRAIRALAMLNNRHLQVDVVVGAHYPALEAAEAACLRHGFRLHVQTSSLAELMATADLAVGAGGSATWERCCLGLPTLAICTAANQKQLIADSAAAGLLHAPDIHVNDVSGLARHLQFLVESPGLRSHISVNGMSAVDGRGVLRVLQRMNCSNITIRPATGDDSEALFTWRNHPAVRAVSRSGDPISLSTHQHWLSSVLADPNRHLLLGIRWNQPIGAVRFDVAGEEAEVSIYLAPDIGEPGVGTELLGCAEQWLRTSRPEVRSIRAEVLGDNLRSHRLFQTSGYTIASSWYGKRAQEKWQRA